MIFFYALGGGLGHITRAQALIHTLGLEEPVTLAMSSAWNDTEPPLSQQFLTLRAPQGLSKDPDGVRRWLSAALAQKTYRRIIIDAFPGGLLGELCDFPFPADAELIHCARLLRWPVYAPMLKGALPRYQRCFQLETLSGDHAAALTACCDRIDSLHLDDPPLDPVRPSPQDALSSAPLWLIVHAGSTEEILELIALARDSAALEGVSPQLVLLSPQRPTALPADVVHRCVYPATPWFAKAQRIFSACGFNTVRQLQPYRHKHRFLPFPRRFDDQFARAAALRAESWEQT
ncbi:hypothetical protein HCH_00078 [Hahella chejuensis KCTC 2396]|uniref:Glycosyl transferase family 28 C-terminal domain-containing protein n=1 Tax=Hahella chejuensis (strain KCTC 2396) TaxID=349521 RepID=Q2SQS5_HAHCH|nr:hypothetical protein [Hahella chejuensis]ABC26999.1 hypothetical protein HCH_00078 [Hahella chejuensis KCTC 2396]